MKTNVLRFMGAVLVPAMFACSSSNNDNANADSTATDSTGMSVSQASYVNLSTGEPVTITQDTEKGYYVYSDTRQPVEKDLFFVDVTSNDTLYGTKGVVVNNAIIKTPTGSWSLNESMVERDGDEIKIKTADGKLKMEGDEMKYKEGEEIKTKVDGEETKSKTSDSKTKTDGAESKSKTTDTKVKVED
ncbi:hypothetical protein ACFSJU_08465 [Paradesertivirga mongoliensis]|uniref:Lipoprotein n=1 Tax=Paradesertivirga mongoliensis TaxID=2100740 RepID=A0ABW4ZK39_9SPHI|nr:hypothetical protein [Pedobacter mongoliensis]